MRATAAPHRSSAAPGRGTGARDRVDARMPHLRLVCFSLAVLVGCDGGSGTGTCAPDADAGTAVATLDGAAWATTATWTWSGESLQINAAPADGWNFSLVGQLTDTGATVKAQADAGAFPFIVPLGQTGGWVTVFPTDGDSYHTKNAAGGTLTVTGVDEALAGCFAFSAGTDAGDTVELADGVLQAAPLGR